MDMGKNIKRRKSTKRQSKIASMLVIAAVVFVCAVVVIRISDLREKSRDLEITQQALERQLEEANLERENLMAQEQYMKTDEYIEDVAKDKLGLVYPDEIVIKPAE